MQSTEPVNGGVGGASEEGRRARKARATRRALLDAGLEAFERQPISLVSVLDITEAADVAKGVFYLHFASKDAFLIELWSDVQNAFLDDVRAAAAEEADARGRIIAAIQQYASVASQHPRRACFLLRMSSFIGAELGPPGQLTHRREAYLNALAEILSPSGRRTRQRKADLATASVLDACCWGVLWQAFQRGKRPVSANHLVKIVLPAVAALADGLASG